jgi:hypothetical protein
MTTPTPYIPRPTDNVYVVPASGVMPLKTLDDWRAFFHQITPVIVTSLVAAHIVTDNDVALWVPFVFAIADPLLSLGNTQDKVRKIIYGLLALIQAGSTVTAVVEIAAQHSSPVVAPVITAVGSIVSGVLGRFFNQTSTMIPKHLIDGLLPEEN